MGSLHLIASVIDFSWLTFNYCLFCYVLVAIFAVLNRLDQGESKPRLYIVGAVCLMALAIPMTVAMVKTILERGTPVYFNPSAASLMVPSPPTTITPSGFCRARAEAISLP